MLNRPPPSQLRQDNDGHWYLVPEDQLTRFEEALALGEEDGYESFFKVKKTEIDGPQAIRLFMWEVL